jgi:hypothetical protein
VLYDLVELFLPLEHQLTIVGHEPLVPPPADDGRRDSEDGAAETDVAAAGAEGLGHRRSGTGGRRGVGRVRASALHGKRRDGTTGGGAASAAAVGRGRGTTRRRRTLCMRAHKERQAEREREREREGERESVWTKADPKVMFQCCCRSEKYRVSHQKC